MNFSVVIPLYNKERHIKRAVTSVLKQGIQSFEIIIVNDGSSDNSLREVNKILDKRIRVINQANQGAAAARNKGIEHAKYDYIAFLDGDDEWKDNFLESVCALIKSSPRAGAYGTGIQRKKTGEADLEYIDTCNEGIIEDYFKYSLREPIISSSSIVIKKAVFKDLGGFNVGFSRGEDSEMWCRIALAYDIAYTNRVCAIYYIDTDNRVCNREFPLSSSFVSNIEELVELYRKGNKKFKYFNEYVYGKLIQRARYKIRENEGIEARKLLRSCIKTKYFKGKLLKYYLLSFIKTSRI